MAQSKSLPGEMTRDTLRKRCSGGKKIQFLGHLSAGTSGKCLSQKGMVPDHATQQKSPAASIDIGRNLLKGTKLPRDGRLCQGPVGSRSTFRGSWLNYSVRGGRVHRHLALKLIIVRVLLKSVSREYRRPAMARSFSHQLGQTAWGGEADPPLTDEACKIHGICKHRLPFFPPSGSLCSKA
jgi:hypothetical protein